MSENHPALAVRGVRKTFEAENAPVRALRGVNLTLEPGEFVALMGPSGCGKSTLLNLVAGLETPDEGEIAVAGEPVTGRTEDELARMRRHHIGLVFQFFNLLEGMTVLENVALPAIIAGRKRKMAETRARDLLDLLGIGDKALAVPGVLSGGQRQRLAIARALANDPTLLLADEPTGALDSAGGAEVIELMRRLHRGGQTIVLVTHAAEVAAAAERVVRMRDGRITEPEPATATPPSPWPADHGTGGRRPGQQPVRCPPPGIPAAGAAGRGGGGRDRPAGARRLARRRRGRLRAGHRLGPGRDRGPGRGPDTPPSPRGQLTLGLLAALGALAAATALTAARIAAHDGTADQHQTARAVATLAAPLVIAVSFHFLLALPDGRLVQSGRRILAVLGYVSAVGTGAGLAVAHQPFGVIAGAFVWPLALLCALPAARMRYVRTAGHDRERMQWLGTGLLVAAEVALLSAVLHLLIDWPGPAGAVAVGAAVAVPLALVLAEWPALAPFGGRILVHAIAAAGSSVIVAAIYLVIVLGFGQAPDNQAARDILGLSVLAAAIAALAFLPARARLTAFATRFVYGTREAPDEALRTFGSRMTRAVAMDELLLQLAESLRKTMGLTRAEIYTGTGRRARARGVRPRRRPRLDRADRPRAARSWPGPGCRATPGPRSGCPGCSRAGSTPSSGWPRSATRATCSA
jgi:putative ABC transport system ATP-binding protein